MRITVVNGRQTRELRRAVLRPNWPADAPMHSDDDPDAIHIAALDDDRTVIGCCIVLPKPYPLHPDEPGAWQLRGMATAPDRQRQGTGALVLVGAMAEIVHRGARLIWCEARTSAVDFYVRQGFVAEGEEFLHTESGIPHFRMWRPLPGTA